MPLQATSGAASYDAFGGGVAAVPNYIEDVFSTYLYTGNSPSTQTITNGIDLATYGGMVWCKSRNYTYNHCVMDTARGNSAGNILFTNSTLAQQSAPNAGISSYNSNGFSLRYDDGWGTNEPAGSNIASWTFRKQPKFFDVVTYTGNGTSGRTISHNLGSVPGFMIVKVTSTADQWCIYHRSQGATKYGLFNTDAFDTYSGTWNNTEPTSTVFTVGNDAFVNANGRTYVAYLFAHDAGGFGLTGTDNVISCGSFTTDSGGNATVSLGYEPAWVMFKCSSNAGQNWEMIDTMRGWSMSTDVSLQANSAAAEASGGFGNPTATGFVMGGQGNTQTYIYIAIRRGPMKVPTSGTSVFAPVLRTGTSAAATVSTGNTPDWVVIKQPLGSNGNAYTRLIGPNIQLYTDRTQTEINQGTGYGVTGYLNTSFTLGLDANSENQSGRSIINWTFSRAPSVCDVVCYTGTGSATTVAHNLGVAPELIIIKKRSNTSDWAVLQTGVQKQLYLNGNYAGDVVNATYFGNDSVYVAPTSTVFSLGSSSGVNGVSGQTFVAYLFATCAGVSKVGSYTGTGTTKQIDCGFTGGARFVLIKRTDSTGDWYVWDSARGIVSGNDPYLLLNSTDAEVTNTDYVDTYSAGFEISSTAPAAINASGGTFIFLAIA